MRRQLTSRNPRLKARAIKAIKVQGELEGYDVRRVTRLAWSTGTVVSGLGHGTVVGTGERFQRYITANILQAD